MQGWTTTMWGMNLQEKELKKDEKHIGKLFSKNLQIKDAS